MNVQDRRTAFAMWRTAVERVAKGELVVSTYVETQRSTVQALLRDIAFRDAVCAEIAVSEPKREATRRILSIVAQEGDFVPAATIVAAINFIEDDMECAQGLVDGILEDEEYSLARLLHNGLAMRAPAGLLQRSFAHFNADDLLEGK